MFCRFNVNGYNINPDPDCYPGVDHTEVYWLGVARELAGGTGHLDGSWRADLFGICAEFDYVADLLNDARSLDRALNLPPSWISEADPAAVVYARHRGFEPDVAYQAEIRDAESALAASAKATLRAGGARAWVYAALTATGLYCPEYRTHLGRHRVELVVLEESVRRCVDDGQSCLRFDDFADDPLAS